MEILHTDMDAAILAEVQPSWRKVALIVSRAAKRMGSWADNDEGYRIAATRIQALVASGRLMSQGNLQQWRYSEVRLP